MWTQQGKEKVGQLETVAWKHIHYHIYVKQIASGNLLYDARSSDQVLCDNLEGWDRVGVGAKFKREGPCVYLWLVHGDVWQKPGQYCN